MGHMFMRGRRSGRSERGVALVEAAITFPIFFLVLIAIFEFGLQYRSSLTLRHATSASARAGSVYGKYGDADHQILMKLQDSLDGINTADIERIVVFKASRDEASIHDPGLVGCLAGSVTDVCNSYVATDLTLPESRFGCGTGSVDAAWCPTDRIDALSGPPDYLGVYIRLRHEAATGLIGSVHQLEQESVIRLEPKER